MPLMRILLQYVRMSASLFDPFCLEKWSMNQWLFILGYMTIILLVAWLVSDFVFMRMFSY